MPVDKRPDHNAMVPALQLAAQALGLDMTLVQQHALLAYLHQLQRWNATYNLTAIRDPQQMLIQHVFDSLAIIAPLRRRWHEAIQVLDVGSGAGLPGVVIGIMQAHWQVTCVDAVEKKTVFIQQVTRKLALENITARHARIETLVAEDGAARYTVAVSRAFGALQNFAVLAGPLVDADGALVAMKAKVPDTEIAAVARETDWCVTAIEPLCVPQLDAQRCLIWLDRRDQDTHGKETHAPE